MELPAPPDDRWRMTALGDYCLLLCHPEVEPILVITAEFSDAPEQEPKRG